MYFLVMEPSSFMCPVLVSRPGLPAVPYRTHTLNDAGRKHGIAIGFVPENMIHVASSMTGFACATRVGAVCSFTGAGVS